MKVLKEDISLAVESIKSGNIVIFPTETVYGLGGNALDNKTVDKIFKAKNRPSNNPLIVHLSDKKDIEKYAYIENEIERKLIDSFMPGPFTLILRKKDIIPSNVTCNMDTVGIRVPSNKIANKFIEECGLPIAAPSANLSTKPSGTNVEDIFDEFKDSVDYIIDGGESNVGLESTVVKVIDGIPTILRPGFITKEDIELLFPKCNIAEGVLKKLDNNSKVESPGMIYKHYAPKTKCLLVYSKDKNELINLVNSNKTNKTLVIGSSILKDIECYKYLYYGDTLIDIAHNIFKLLRESDNYDQDLIIIEGVESKNLGLAIMNRLLRSCAFNYIEK